MQYPGKLPSIHTSTDSSVNPSGSLSITSSPSTEKLSIIPGNNGEKHAVNYLHKILVKSPSIHTSYGTPVIAPVHASSIPSIHTSYAMSVTALVCASSVPSVHTSCIMSVIAPVHALSTEHIHTSCITSVVAPICGFGSESLKLVQMPLFG